MVHPSVELAIYIYCLLVGSIGLALYGSLWWHSQRQKAGES